MKGLFYDLSDELFKLLGKDEHLYVDLTAEDSHFVRFNNAKVRQAGLVKDGELKLRLIKNDRVAIHSIDFLRDKSQDFDNAKRALKHLQDEVTQLPEDPFVILPEDKGSSDESYTGHLLDPGDVFENILSPFKGKTAVGFYQSGPIVSATANSSGQKHWFSTERYSVDYSLLGPNERAVKTTYAGGNWRQNVYNEKAELALEQLNRLDRPVKELKKGQYRAYLAPAALNEIMHIMAWSGLSEASYRQGQCGLRKLKEGANLSDRFTLKENFSQGTVPRFNSLGEVSGNEVPLIDSGELKQFLVSSRTAKEYDTRSNLAGDDELPRSPEVAAGTLKQDDILKQLDTGIYLSNLHYLNWSDPVGGRVTGMTRYACFWVENGELKAPIQNMRFDETLYSLLGENLENLTDFQEFNPVVDTYYKRSLGGALLPGLLSKSFNFTL